MRSLKFTYDTRPTKYAHEFHFILFYDTYVIPSGLLKYNVATLINGG